MNVFYQSLSLYFEKKRNLYLDVMRVKEINTDIFVLLYQFTLNSSNLYLSYLFVDENIG